jgi:hypothetical protein
MSSTAPIYTADNCTFAYQLIWNLNTFWKEPQCDEGWLEDLQEATETDGIRILKHRFETQTTSHFLVSTKPAVKPRLIPQRIKGRVQHLIRKQRPKAFRRNYCLRSMGSTRREKVEKYLETQVAHHPMADERVQERMEKYQIHRPDTDLSRQRRTSHGCYWYNLHVVFANGGGWTEIRDQRLMAMRDMVLKASERHGHLLSRAGILASHVHLTLGCDLEEAPDEVALSYMNNPAYACGMERLFTFSRYVGTFGEYDLGAVE